MVKRSAGLFFNLVDLELQRQRLTLAQVEALSDGFCGYVLDPARLGVLGLRVGLSKALTDLLYRAIPGYRFALVDTLEQLWSLDVLISGTVYLTVPLSLYVVRGDVGRRQPNGG